MGYLWVHMGYWDTIWVHMNPLCLRNLCEKEGERNSKSAKESLRETEHEGLTN